MSEILTFSVVALLLVMSPGPNGVLILKTASSLGRSASFANIAGLFVATFCHGALSIFGLSALLLQSAELFTLVKIIGALYLFYIGAKAIYNSYKKSDITNLAETDGLDGLLAESPQSSDVKKVKTGVKGIVGSFSEGFLTQLLNPKVSMFYLAAFPQFVSFDAASYAIAFSLVAIHACIIVTWFVGVTMAIDQIKQRGKHSNIGRWVQRLSGSVMIYFSALLLGQKA